jgi:RNA polymerase sigma-70 factor (ECF subfamily)
MKRPCGPVERFAKTGDRDSREVQLFKQVQANDRIAFREVVEQLKNKVYSVSYALLGNASEADVAAQKIFVRLYHAAGRVGRQRDLMKCAYRFAIDQCMVELRRRRIRKLFGWLVGPTSIPDPNALAKTDENRERILVVRSLSMLSDKERALLVLKEIADQTVEEIADIMHLEPATVRRRLYDARQRFRISVAAAEVARNHSTCT